MIGAAWGIKCDGHAGSLLDTLFTRLRGVGLVEPLLSVNRGHWKLMRWFQESEITCDRSRALMSRKFWPSPFHLKKRIPAFTTTLPKGSRRTIRPQPKC